MCCRIDCEIAQLALMTSQMCELLISLSSLFAMRRRNQALSRQLSQTVSNKPL
jgi:hypothetical protein